MSVYAQAHGRHAASREEELEMDLRYVDHIVHPGDVRRILDTIMAVVKREGIDTTTTQTVTMEGFKGTIEEEK